MQSTPEDEPAGNGLPPAAIRMLAGLEVGLVAGLPAIGWLLLHSWLRGEPWWAKLNVAGALFFGGSVYSMGLSRASLAGCALLVVGYTLLGVAFGLIARPRGVTRNLLLGVLIAIAWQLVCQQYLLRRIDPFAPAYFPPLSTLPAQLMFGLGLARFGPRFRALASAWGDPSWVNDWVLTWTEATAPELLETIPPSAADGSDQPFVGPLPEVFSPEPQENALSSDSEPPEAKRTSESDC